MCRMSGQVLVTLKSGPFFNEHATQTSCQDEVCHSTGVLRAANEGHPDC